MKTNLLLILQKRSLTEADFTSSPAIKQPRLSNERRKWSHDHQGHRNAGKKMKIFGGFGAPGKVPVKSV